MDTDAPSNKSTNVLNQLGGPQNSDITTSMNQSGGGDTEDTLSSFAPVKSGQMTRFIDKDDVREGQASAVDQAIGLRSPDTTADNANDYVYQRTTEFPQPSIAGIGVVTSAGVPDTTRYFFSQKWTVNKTATGIYQITHGIGDGKYNVVICPVTTTAFTAVLSSFTAALFEVRTFNAAGVATDCSFTFVVYIIP